MIQINKVAHVVLNVKDVEASATFYNQVLGMEIMNLNLERPMAFLSFGTQHHDLALFKAPEGSELGSLGLNHMAMQIQGGEAELEVMHRCLLDHGVTIRSTQDHGVTKSVYFSDPDGNGLEIFCEMMSPEEGLQEMRERGGVRREIQMGASSSYR